MTTNVIRLIQNRQFLSCRIKDITIFLTLKGFRLSLLASRDLGNITVLRFYLVKLFVNYYIDA